MNSFERAQPVGLVVGTTAATPLQFSVAICPDQYLQLDDVVVTSRELPGQPPVRISGVVTNVEAVHEGARFASDVFLIQQGALPAEIAEVAQVTVTRVEPEVYVPPMPGAAGHPGDREAARLGALLRRDGRPEGPGWVRPRRPARLHQLRVRRRHPRRARLHLRASPASRPRRASRCSCCTRSSTPASWPPKRTTPRCWCSRSRARTCCSWTTPTSGLPLSTASATKNWGFRRRRSRTSGSLPLRGRATRPGRPTCPRGTRPSARSTGRSREFCEDELLPFVFADAEDERAQYTMLIGQVAARLKRDAVSTGNDGAVRISGVDPANDKIIRSFGDLVELLEAELGDDSLRGSWVAGQRGHRQHQRAAAPAPLGGQAAYARSSAATWRTGASDPSPPAAPRSRSSTCTTCPTGRSGSSSASRCGASSPARNARAPPGR